MVVNSEGAGGGAKFAAKRVPDFAKLHALEDARVARWKRQNKRDVTVPLGFRFNKDLQTGDDRPSTGSNMSARPSTSRTTGEANSGSNNNSSGSNLRGRKAGDASDLSHKENADNQNVQGEQGRGLPAHVMYPQGVKQRPMTAPPSEQPQQQGHRIKDPQAPPTGYAGRARDAGTSSSGSEASKAMTAVGGQERGAASGSHQRHERPSTAAPYRRGEAGGNKDWGAGEGHEGGGRGMQQQQQQQQQQQHRPATAPRESQREAQVVDIKALRKLAGSLSPASLRQSFNSADFYIFGKTLGEGAYGKVKLGTHVLSDEKVAVKTFEKSKLTESHARKRVAREIRILKALEHPNIIKLYEVVDVPARKYLIMQFSSGGDLCRYVREKRRLGDEESCRLFCQIVRGLEYCHSCGIVHRDVKLDNLLIDENRNIKIVDFGFSVSFKEGQKLRKACGSPSYAAPEIVSRRPYSPTGVDVWSLGVVLYAMVCGYFPFQGSSNQDLCRRIVKGKFDCPSFMTSECKDLVRQMLNVNAEQRIGLSKCAEHPWCATMMQAQSAHAPSSSWSVRPIDCERSDDSMDMSTGRAEMPIDEGVLMATVQLGFTEEYARACVRRNMHNLCCTSYWLLLQRKYAQGRGAAAPAPGGGEPAKRMMV